MRQHVVVRLPRRGVDEGQLVHHGRHVREQVGNPCPRLAVLLKFERTLHQRTRVSLTDPHLAFAFLPFFPPDYNQRVPCFVPTFASNDASFPVHTDGSITWLNYLQSFDDWPDHGAISGRFTSPTSFEGAFACNEFGHGMQPITFSMHWAAAPVR